MIPSTTFTSTTTDDSTSKTYALDRALNQISGFVDGIDAIKQSIFHILSTERYEHSIYSTNYGIELANLYGMSIDFVSTLIEDRIIDALTQDDRISSVNSCYIQKASSSTLSVQLDITTIYGDLTAETVVNY